MEDELRAAEDHAEKLAADLAVEREASTAAQRRCNAAERQLAIEECRVR